MNVEPLQSALDEHAALVWNYKDGDPEAPIVKAALALMSVCADLVREAFDDAA